MLGVKWRFFDAGETGWQMSTYPQVEFRNPGSRSAERGLAEEGTTVLVPFEFQRAFAALGVNFEVGRAFSSRSDDEWFGGVVIDHEFDAGFELMAEVHGESSQSLDRSAVAANVGTRIEWPHHGTLLVSLGRDLHNRLDERSAVFGYLGWQVQL